MKKIKKPLFGLLFLLAALTSCEYDGIDPITAVDAGTDAGSPVITILYPTEGTAIQVPEAVATINIRLEVVDDIEVEKIEVLVDGTQIAMFDEFTDYRIVKRTVTFDNVTNGEHTLTVIATDISGNVTTKEVNFSKEPPYSPKFAGEFFYMPFDGDFMELVNIYTAEEVGNPTTTTASFFGTGAYKGVADSYITVPLNEDDLGAEFSAAFWYKMDTTEGRAGILTASGNVNDLKQGFRLFREGPLNSHEIKLNVGTGDSESYNVVSAPAPGEWVHIAFSISATQTVFYINGIPLSTANRTSPIDWTGVEELTIGSGGEKFTIYNHKSDTNSLIDELRLFDTALTQGDIQNLINASAETLYMPFDGEYKDMVSNREVTVVGSPGFAGESKVGSNAYAGATSSYLTLPSAGLTGESFSATMWYKLDAVPNRAGILVIGPEDPDNAGYPEIQNNRKNGFRFFREQNADGFQRFKLQVGDGTANDVWVDGNTVADVPNDAGWVHLAFTISPTKAIVYINGLVVKETTFTGIDWTGADLVSIMSGAPRFTDWGHLSDSSYMDELRFYNKELTQNEIQAAMSN